MSSMMPVMTGIVWLKVIQTKRIASGNDVLNDASDDGDCLVIQSKRSISRNAVLNDASDDGDCLDECDTDEEEHI
uniref:Uncharacterized protein n=1 Tax=Timema poppense TaxID=170557 RepID=A0A7R9HIS7_TIMPO|nr:unnamed protein product [Timema poppensis]